MISIFDDTTDVSGHLKPKSLRINEQMANRKNTSQFSLIDRKIEQGKSVYVYDALDLVANAAAGTNILYVEDTYQDCDKWQAGDIIIVGARTGVERKYEIDSVDHAAKTVELTENLDDDVTKGETVCGRLIFAGVCMSNPDEEVGNTGKFEFDYKLVDWTTLYDRKNVIQQFQNMYAREIIGRIVYFFCPTDTSLPIDSFESAWTHGGQALAMADETTDRLVGTKSQKTGTSASGTATWTKTVSSLDLSGYTHARFWHKIAAGDGGKVTGMKLRMGTDASNYFEWIIPNVGAAFEDCWNYESVIINEFSSSTGSPDITDIDWVQIVVTCNAAIDAGNLRFDSMTATTGSFTIQNVTRGDIKFPDVRVPYQKASIITESIAKGSSLFWFIDYERDIHLFQAATTPAPWGITDTSLNYYDLKIEADITKLKNRQIVIGGEAPSEELYTQPVVADGSQTSFALDYKPKDLVMTVEGVPQALGVEGFVDESTVDWIWNFQEKVVRQAQASTPVAGDEVEFQYYPYKPIRVSVTAPASILTMQALTGGDGYYDGAPIKDADLSSFEDARIRGRAELQQYANAIVTASFGTFHDGLRAGQSIPIEDTSRGVDESFLIQTISWRQKEGSRFEYTVSAASTLFGLIEFIQMLLRRSDKLSINPSELVDTILNLDEIITIDPQYTFNKRDKVVYATLRLKKIFDFVEKEGSAVADGVMDTAKQWYVEFIGSETGEAEFTTSRHNNDAELKLSSEVGGNGKELKVRTTRRFHAAPSTQYDVRAWTEILAALSNVGTGGGFQMVVKEWAAREGGSALASNTIFSAVTGIHDFTRRSSTFTTHASTQFMSIEISLYRAVGDASIADITLIPATVETATLPAVASFCQAT